MKRAEIDWKARQIHHVWRRVQERVCLDHKARFDNLRDGDKSTLRTLAQQGIGVIDKAWLCEKKRRAKKGEAYRSPYKERGLHPSKSLRER